MSAVSHLQTGWIPKVYLHVSCLRFETHFFPQRQCFKRGWCPGLHNKDSKVGIHPIGWRVSDKPNNSLRTRIHLSINLAAEAVVRGWGWSWDVLHPRGKKTESRERFDRPQLPVTISEGKGMSYRRDCHYPDGKKFWNLGPFPPFHWSIPVPS